jgi:hypothetical protein
VPAIAVKQHRAFDGGDPANSGPECETNAFRVNAIILFKQAGFGHCFLRCCEPIVHELIVAPHFLARDEISRLEISDFPCNTRIHFRDIEFSNRTDATATITDGVPALGNGVANRG